MWLKSERLGKFVYVTYAAVTETKSPEADKILNLSLELESDLKRDIDWKLAVLRLLQIILQEARPYILLTQLLDGYNKKYDFRNY